MKYLLALYMLACFTVNALAQPVKKQAKKKSAATTKKVKPASRTRTAAAGGRFLEDQSGLFTFYADAGDTLVYEVNAGGQVYDFVVALTVVDRPGRGIAFNWVMTDPVNRSGSVKISKAGVQQSRSYVNRFGDGALNLTDACTVFMTALNFSEMSDRKTVMIMDGVTDTFYRPVPDEVPVTIICRGKTYVLDGFKITDMENGAGSKELVIQNTSVSPIILKMELGFSIRLKEIR